MPEPSRIPLSQRPRAPQGAPQPQAKAQAAPAPKPQRRPLINVSWWQGFALWLAGAVFFPLIAIGPGVYTQNWLVREDEARLVEMAVPDSAIATALLSIDAKAREAEEKYLAENPDVRAPASDMTVLVGSAPRDRDLWDTVVGRPGSLQMAGAWLDATPAPLIVLPGLVSGLIVYLGASLMAFVWWLMQGRRG